MRDTTSDVDAGVDLIISIQVPTTSGSERYASLLQELQKGGLKAVGRPGESDGVLVFICCSDETLRNLVRKERESDFLSGIPVIPAPNQCILSPAERIRIIHSYITSAPSDGGLGIHPDVPRWDFITSIFCLHDREFNDQWIHAWTTNWLSTASVPQEHIRAHFGDAFSLYFIFIQSYTRALAVPALFGVICWFLGASYSPLYSLFTSIWAIGFVEWWRVEERRVALRFGVRGAAKVEKARVQNAHMEGSLWMREVRILASIPIIMGFAVLLAVLMTGIFFMEEFCEHFYTGPGKQYVSFAPTIIYAILVPHLISYFQSCAERFATWENHAQHSTHEASVTLKTFIFTALVAYLSLTLTALVYVPFGDALVKAALELLARTSYASFDTSSLLAARSELKLDRSRLEEQMFAYTVTNNVMDSMTELGWPYVMKIWENLLELIGQKNSKHSHTKILDVPTTDSPPSSPTMDESPQSPFASAFSHLRSFSVSLMNTYNSKESLLDRALHESTLPSTPSNLSNDYSEMVIQFGYIVLWSTIFPLAPFFALLNNVMEMRKDAFRIAMHERRPIPERTESIGPWLEVLGFLGWGSAVVNIILVGLFCPKSLADEGKCGYLIDLTGDTATPIEMISVALSDAVWDSTDAAAWHELGLTIILLVLGASQAWVVVRGVMRHIIHKVIWEGSKEVEEWGKEERTVKEGFLTGLVEADSAKATSDVGKSSKRKRTGNKKKGKDRESTLTPTSSSESLRDFYGREEGLDEMRRLRKEE